MSEQTEEPIFEERTRWRIDHKVPITLIFTLLLQTGAGVAFFTNLSGKVDEALKLMAEFKAERYTKEDARRDREVYQLLINNIAAKDAEIARRVQDLETQMAEHRKEISNRR